MKNLLIYGWMCVMAAFLTGCGRQVEIIAHRGASYDAPENTLAAVNLAWRQGFDVEVDMHLSADKRIVVIHDKDTKRTAGRKLVVAETASDELRKLDVGSFKSQDFAGERMPFLEEVLETIPPHRKLYVEIKSGPETVDVLVPVLLDSGRLPQIVIIGFDLETVALAKQRLPQTPVYWLKGPDKQKGPNHPSPPDTSLIRTAQDKNLDGLDVHYAGVTEEFANAVRASNLGLYVWTVDDLAEAQRLVSLKVDGITTNRPAWLSEQLAATRNKTSRNHKD